MFKGRKWRACSSNFRDALGSVHTLKSFLLGSPAASIKVEQLWPDCKACVSHSTSEKHNARIRWPEKLLDLTPSTGRSFGLYSGASSPKTQRPNPSKLAFCGIITSNAKASSENPLFSIDPTRDCATQMRLESVIINKMPVFRRKARDLKSKQIDLSWRLLGFDGEAVYWSSYFHGKVSYVSNISRVAVPNMLPRVVPQLFHISQQRVYSSYASCGSNKPGAPEIHDHSQRAVVTALWCNFLVFGLKCGVWLTTASHVMLAEAVHSLADLANQALLAYGLISSKRAPDALHPYGYSKERFVWSLISAVGIFCLGSGATIVHGVANLWHAQPIENILSAAMVLGGSTVMEGASLFVAVNAVRKGAAAEGMKLKDYLWRGHDPTAVAVMMEDSAAVAGLLIAGIALTTANVTGNPIWDPIGSILVGNLLGVVAIFLIQRNRHALLGRSIDATDMELIMQFLSTDPVVDAVYDCKSEVIGPGAYRFKAEIDFNGVAIVRNYLERAGRESWMKEFREAVKDPKNSSLERVLAIYGEAVVTALGSEVDRLEKEIKKIVPGIRHVDIEAHNPKGALP